MSSEDGCSSGFFSFQSDAVQHSSILFLTIGALPTRWRQAVDRHRALPSQI